jgi:hypothetical protein
VNRFRGLLVPRLDWIKALYLFGTLGLHRLLTKTLKFFNKISKFLEFQKNSKFQKFQKKFKIFIRFVGTMQMYVEVYFLKRNSIKIKCP